MGSFSRLGTEATVVDDAMKGHLKEAATAVNELYDLVKTRQESNQGVVGQVYAFWTSNAYRNKAQRAKERVDNALESLMLRSNPQPSTLNPQPSTLNPQPSTLSPQPSTLNPQHSTLNPQPSTLDPRP